MEERLGIVGGGAIACGLAAVAASHGEVVMLVRNRDSRERACAALESLALESGDRIRVETHTSALDDRTFVVEAIIEDESAKRRYLRRRSRRLDPEAIIGTTTSSLSVAALAEASGRLDRFVGFHPFNPVPKMPLVELAFPPGASADTRRRAQALCAALDKTAVEVPDVPGFVVNRLLSPTCSPASACSRRRASSRRSSTSP
jgi:3-hydroxybutyryl-CoA dehydrogenase